jgi:hypothetical protein
MSHEEKIHVIGAGDVLDVRDHPRKATTAPTTPLTARAPHATPVRTVAYAPPVERSTSPAERAPSMHYALLIALTWLLGPAALLLTPAGRRGRGWVALGLVAAASALVILLVPYAAFVPVTGLSTPLAWSVLAALATIGGFTAWARAVQLASAALPPLHKLPRLLRSRAGVFVLGLLAPGAGMLASGGRLRAGLWLWLLWPAALGLAVLRSAAGMWEHLAMTLANSAAADLLEVSILVSAGAVVVGVLVWVAQALEGARRLAPVPALSRHRGDWFAVALGVSCAALAVGGNPGHVARELGDAALVLRAEGLTIIPLQLSLAADRLDPSRAEYAVQAIALHEARGDHARAAALRARLDEGLASYLTLLGSDPAPSGPGGEAATDPVRPGGDDVYYGTLARHSR